MALSNHERVSKALDLLKEGLRPFVEREMKAQHAQLWFEQAKASVSDSQASLFGTEAEPRWDVAALLMTMWNQWQAVFRKPLGQAERTLVSELREVRNRWAHQKPFTTDDAYRALDSAHRLLQAVSALEATDVDTQKQDLLRVRFEEQARKEVQKTAVAPVAGQPASGLRPWRQVVTPHPDVASGKYPQAEFAADLGQVYRAEGSDEYRDPREFFRRTYMTEGLKQLLSRAVLRVSTRGGDPVVELQTNFGGGKTHALLALYHLFSGTQASDLAGVEEVIRLAETTRIPVAKRVALNGRDIPPGPVRKKPDGTV